MELVSSKAVWLASFFQKIYLGCTSLSLVFGGLGIVVNMLTKK
jgi:hypothetical protein